MAIVPVGVNACSTPNCGNPARARQLCVKHYGRQRRAAAGAGFKTSSCDPRVRIVERVRVTESGCWEWQGARDPEGYGAIRSDGKTLRAHRFSFEAFVGPIPTGLVMDHLCVNPPCVNPRHLEPVTRRENTLRSSNHIAVHMRRLLAESALTDRGHDRLTRSQS